MTALYVVPGRMLEAAGWKVCVGNTLGFGECGEPGLAWAGQARLGGGGDPGRLQWLVEGSVLHPVWNSSQCVLSGRSGVLWVCPLPMQGRLLPLPVGKSSWDPNQSDSLSG